MDLKQTKNISVKNTFCIFATICFIVKIVATEIIHIKRKTEQIENEASY